MSGIKFSSGYVGGLAASYLQSKPKASGSSTKGAYFKEWEHKYENLKFYAGEAAFDKKGIGNVTIARAQLNEIEKDSAKRAEFEKMLEDCNTAAGELKSRGGSKLVSQGFFYTKTGELHGWTFAKNYKGINTKYLSVLDREKPYTWFASMTAYTMSSDPDSRNWKKRFSR